MNVLTKFLCTAQILLFWNMACLDESDGDKSITHTGASHKQTNSTGTSTNSDLGGNTEQPKTLTTSGTKTPSSKTISDLFKNRTIEPSEITTVVDHLKSSANISDDKDADNTKYFVMIGDTGVGKSTIYEKITGESGLSGKAIGAFTTESRVGFVDGIIIADTPGTTSKGNKSAHALQILGALAYRQITSLIFVVTIADRIDATTAKVSNVIRPFHEFDDISVIITKHDSQSWIDEGQLEEEIKSIEGIAHVYISSNESNKSDYVKFLNGINYAPVDATEKKPQELPFKLKDEPTEFLKTIVNNQLKPKSLLDKLSSSLLNQ